MEVIKAPNIDKLVMFECAEVLNEVLKAVSSGKKARASSFLQRKNTVFYLKK